MKRKIKELCTSFKPKKKIKKNNQTNVGLKLQNACHMTVCLVTQFIINITFNENSWPFMSNQIYFTILTSFFLTFGMKVMMLYF